MLISFFDLFFFLQIERLIDQLKSFQLNQFFDFFYEGAMPRFSIAAAAANMAQYLSQSHNGQLKGHSGALVDRSHLYWPGLQGLVTNPMAWRDRLTNSSKYTFLIKFCLSVLIS